MFEDDTCWRSKYFKLCRELGEIINEQQDKIMSLSSENKRLNRENWNLKQTKRRIKWAIINLVVRWTKHQEY